MKRNHRRIKKIPTSKIFGFTHRYSQSFLDQLAKDLGFEWTKVKIECIDNNLVNECPLSPPSGIIFYKNF